MPSYCCRRLTLQRGLALVAAFFLCALAAAASAQEQPEAERAEQSQGRLDPEIRRLMDELRRLLPDSAQVRRRILKESPDLYALGMLKVEKANIALSQPLPSDYSRQVAVENLSEATAIWRALGKGERPALKERGRLERAYLARNDMSPQPYVLYVPEPYDGEEPYGLLVFLHGYVSYLNKANWVESQYSPALETLAEGARCIVLMPYARSNTDFQGAGEDDVMRAIREVKARYRIDEDRVFLSGISMGGMGVWTIGGHYPHEFAGLIAVASRGDFYMWKGIERAGLPGFKAKLAEGEFGAEMIPNYRNLPCVIVHGLADRLMPIEQSERMYELLAGQGFDVEYAQVPGATHYSWTELLTRAEVLSCLKEKHRQTAPRSITFRTYTLKYSRAYWCEITGIGDWGQAAELTCELDQAGAGLRVETTNVTGLRLRPPLRLVKEPEELRVTWNGKAVAPHKGEGGWLDLGRQGAAADVALKTPTLCGPIREVFAGPFILVYDGERGGDSFRSAMQAGADWLRFAQGVPSVLPADAISPEMMERYNLVLFGTPEQNGLVARLAPELPIGLGGGKYVVGEHTYEASKYGLSMIYPNPLAPERYVVINAGTPWGSGLAVNHKYDMLPDFIIFTDETSDDGTDSNEFACAGFFDQRWRLSGASTWYAPDPQER